MNYENKLDKIDELNKQIKAFRTIDKTLLSKSRNTIALD